MIMSWYYQPSTDRLIKVRPTDWAGYEAAGYLHRLSADDEPLVVPSEAALDAALANGHTAAARTIGRHLLATARLDGAGQARDRDPMPYNRLRLKLASLPLYRRQHQDTWGQADASEPPASARDLQAVHPTLVALLRVNSLRYLQARQDDDSSSQDAWRGCLSETAFLALATRSLTGHDHDPITVLPSPQASNRAPLGRTGARRGVDFFVYDRTAALGPARSLAIQVTTRGLRPNQTYAPNIRVLDLSTVANYLSLSQLLTGHSPDRDRQLDALEQRLYQRLGLTAVVAAQ